MSLINKIKKFTHNVKNDSYSMLADVSFKMNKLDDNGAIGGWSVGGIIGFAIALVVLASVVPTAIDSFYQTNTTAWQINGSEDSKTVMLWWLLPLIIIAVVIMAVYKNVSD